MSEEKRKRVPKEEQSTVTVPLDDSTRKMLLDLNREQCELADLDVPLNATVKRAVKLAWKERFSPKSEGQPPRKTVPVIPPADEEEVDTKFPAG